MNEGVKTARKKKKKQTDKETNVNEEYIRW